VDDAHNDVVPRTAPQTALAGFAGGEKLMRERWGLLGAAMLQAVGWGLIFWGAKHLEKTILGLSAGGR
jgi:hypothetical protein